jgi:beta-glucanase (GH16 family)
MDTLSDTAPNSQFLGDASKTNWVTEGVPVVYQNDSILLTMAEGTAGTLMSSTHFVWYGKVSATLKTSAGPGVVTAFILQSNVRDEIDFEFVGTDLQHVQSNFYWQGALNYTNSANLTAVNTNTETHVYTINWTPEMVQWEVDNVVLRTLYAKDTYNVSTGQYMFPQTPSRVMLSLWPAGNPGNGEGTINWAGGLIGWNSPYMVNGYYYAQITDITVECYDPPSGANMTGTGAYTYNSDSGMNDSVVITNDQTVLGSFYASGDNIGYNPNAASSASVSGKASSTGTGIAYATQGVNTVPGSVGAGTNPGSGDGGNLLGTNSGTTGSGSTDPGIGGFIQGTEASTSTSEGNKGSASFFGVVVAVVVAMCF